VAIDLAEVPLSDAYRRFAGDDRAARIEAVTAGDDYQLLFAAPPDLALPVAATRVGAFRAPAKAGALGPNRTARDPALLPSQEHDLLILTDGGAPIPLPDRLGFAHGD
jgi:thiamine-monophosphate kinase